MPTENCVALRSLADGKLHRIETLEGAIEALDDLGHCMNWGILIPGDHLATLLYEGWMYRQSFERYVELPFDSSAENFAELFQKLLNRIFDPFLDKRNSIHRSLIHVERGTDLRQQECFFVTLVLVFRESGASKAKVIAETLRKVADSEDKVRGIGFCLD